ncbi:MAG: leucine--tRNA ligase, partial [Halobacteriovoraceae bacterium]|nr:leucine--tRNA ligase [Halobacteriovoraceae bacterium]
PYPSGDGLHVGHPEGYTATDIICRYKRMKGFQVLHPMGWDSFGLPTENHAIKTGIHPKKITKDNIATFKRQLKSLGFSYDWNREFATSDEDYYKWTQWIFVKLYEKGLAYEDEVEVNWCAALGTVLANEEVIDGRSERGDHPVERKKMKQWMLKITDYAERLLVDLDELDWPLNVKEMQKNWIGKSEGTLLTIKLQGMNENIRVFTTRADTLFGVSYVVLAPEHPLVEKIVSDEQRKSVQEYLIKTKGKSDLSRVSLDKEKTGVFTGAWAIIPASNKKVPVWIADYVLNSYGTGAVMAVPAHDTRDFAFAKKFGLPVWEVVSGGDISKNAYTAEGTLINSDFLDGLFGKDAIEKINSWLEQEKLGERKVQYKLRDWIFSRQRYWGEPFPLLKYEDGTIRCLEEDELPLILPEVKKYGPSGSGESPLATIKSWVDTIDPKTKKKAKRETDTMPNWAGSCWYYLRFCDPKNIEAPWDKKLENYWMPVDLYVGGVEHAVLHLLYARFWHKVFFDLGLVSTKEPFLKLVNQGLILGHDGEKMSKSRGNVVNPDNIVEEYGADSLRLYEMFMGPLEKVKPWQQKGVKGVHNFLAKTFRFFGDPDNWKTQKEDLEVLKMLHKTIKKVGEDIEKMHFNTAISQMMIFSNFALKQKTVSKDTVRDFTLLLAPFAPHMAEELWQVLGNKESLAFVSWPSFDSKLASDDLITVGIQINGKTRGKLEVPQDISKEEFLQKAKELPNVAKYIADKKIIKEIYVPGKICNFVLS